jgi:LacI family transcriptional regulator
MVYSQPMTGQRGTKKSRNVALIVETSNGYARGILHGIRDFLREKPGWSIYLAEHGRHEADHSLPDDWDGDGVIARIETKTIARLIGKMGVPTVDVSAARLIHGIPWVETDDEAITELAVEHLLSCGLRNFAFFGDPAYNWSKWRCRYFKKFVSKKGFNPRVFNLPSRTEPQVQWYKERDRIFEWLRELPKPVGIFACYDACGQQLLEVCRYHELTVPDEVAVIGVDNDELLCDLSSPSLSSVAPNSRQTGYLAASLLDRMMNGEHFKEMKFSIRPLGIEKRVSTDLVAVQDPYVSQAISFIREHVRENIQVEDILKTVSLSRRIFERRFRQTLNRTPHQEILRVRIDCIKKLLVETDRPLAAIAYEMGFPHPEYLSVIFKKETGLRPSEYRNQAGRMPRTKTPAT